MFGDGAIVWTQIPFVCHIRYIGYKRGPTEEITGHVTLADFSLSSAGSFTAEYGNPSRLFMNLLFYFAEATLRINFEE